MTEYSHRSHLLAGVLLGAVLALPLAAPARAESAAELAQERCAACHGPTGISEAAEEPKLAGQKSAYLRAQLAAFRSGARPSDEMHAMATELSDAQIVALADFYAGQKPQPDPPAKPALVQAGAQLFVAHGRGIPPCAACHSDSGDGNWQGGPGFGGGWGYRGGMGGGMGGGMMGGGGMGPGRAMLMATDPALTPRLNGQHAAYLAKALGDYADGRRASPVMQSVAASLTAGQRQAVAAYLAGLN